MIQTRWIENTVSRIGKRSIISRFLFFSFILFAMGLGREGVSASPCDSLRSLLFDDYPARNPTDGSEKKYDFQSSPHWDKAWQPQIETVWGKGIRFFDLSGLAKGGKGIAPYPPDYDPKKDVIIGLSPRSYHMFIIADDVEFHSSIFYKAPAKVIRPHSKTIKAWVFFRLKGLSEDRVQQLKKSLSALEGLRSFTCIHGSCYALKHGSGITVRRPFFGNSSISGFLRTVLESGFTDREGSPIALDIYRTIPASFEALHRHMQWRLEWLWGGWAPIGFFGGFVLKQMESEIGWRILFDFKKR